MNLSINCILFILTFGLIASANLYDLRTPPENQNCHVYSGNEQGGPGLKYVQCQKKDTQIADQSFLIVEAKFQDLPQFIREDFQDRRPDIKSWDRVYLSITTENDDLVLFGMCRARDTACSDDAGYTVGSAISLGGVYQNKYNVELKLQNGLYTKPYYDLQANKPAGDGSTQQPSEGVRRGKQNFRSTLLLELLVDSAYQKKLHYWSIGTGLIALSSTGKFGILDASRQQSSVHEMMNQIGQDLAVVRENVYAGEKDQWGAYLLAGWGMQKFISHGGGVTTRSYAQIMARVSSLPYHSNVKFEMGQETGHRLEGGGRISAGGSVAVTQHAQGRLNEYTAYVKYESGQSWEAQLAFTCQSGDLQNYASYNIPNIVTGKPECYYRLQGKYYFNVN